VKYDADKKGPERLGHVYGTSLRIEGNHHAKGIRIKLERSKAILKARVTGKTMLLRACSLRNTDGRGRVSLRSVVIMWLPHLSEDSLPEIRLAVSYVKRS
jgi:hypothetical protein